MTRIRVIQDKGSVLARLFCPIALALAQFALSINLAGCSNSFFDPKEIGRFRPNPAVNIILPSLGVAEETPSAWVGAEDPRPVDVMTLEKDHVLSPGDIVAISIYELLAEDILFTNQYIVNETGRVSIPVVGIVEAAGLTEAQLEDEIRRILSPAILKDPAVTATLLRSDRRMVSILGLGVAAPSRYLIPRSGWRLADAIAAAGGIGEFNVTNIFVARAVSGEEVTGEPQEAPKQLGTPEQEMLELITPQARRREAQDRFAAASAQMARNKELAAVALPDGIDGAAVAAHRPAAGSHFVTSSEMGTGPQAGRTIEQEAKHAPTAPGRPGDRLLASAAVNDELQGRVEWVFQDGRWVPVQVGRPEAVKTPRKVEQDAKRPIPSDEAPADYGWDEIGAGGAQARVIRIPVDRFQAADRRYNIVIRPGDTIYVPADIIGEFYIMGHTDRRGPISLQGRPMTLKMAIAAAGGLGELAWPKRCEVIRRLGEDREEIVMVDLEKIARGEQPDFFIKPDDLINVGTHPMARFGFVLRNAFRATYGFGFVYDRNFADRDFGTHRPFPGGFPSVHDIF